MKGEGKIGEGKKGGRNGKIKPLRQRVTVNKTQRNLRTSRVSVKTAESTDTRHPRRQVKGKGKAKSKVFEVSESENNKHDAGPWTPASSPQPSSKDCGFSHWKTAPNIDKQ